MWKSQQELQKIGELAFCACQLETFYLPSTLEKKCYNAIFLKEGCVLNEINFDGTVEQWDIVERGEVLDIAGGELPVTVVQCTNGEGELNIVDESEVSSDDEDQSCLARMSTQERNALNTRRFLMCPNEFMMIMKDALDKAAVARTFRALADFYEKEL